MLYPGVYDTSYIQEVVIHDIQEVAVHVMYRRL